MADEEEGEGSGSTSKRRKTTHHQIERCLSTLSRNLRAVLKESESKYNSKASIDDFIKNDLSGLGKSIGFYTTCMTDLSVYSYKELHDLVGQHFSCPEVHESYELLVDVEELWSNHLEKIERDLNEQVISANTKEKGVLTKGSYISMALEFVDVETSKLATLSGLRGDNSAILLVLLRHLA